MTETPRDEFDDVIDKQLTAYPYRIKQLLGLMARSAIDQGHRDREKTLLTLRGVAGSAHPDVAKFLRLAAHLVEEVMSQSAEQGGRPAVDRADPRGDVETQFSFLPLALQQSLVDLGESVAGHSDVNREAIITFFDTLASRDDLAAVYADVAARAKSVAVASREAADDEGTPE